MDNMDSLKRADQQRQHIRGNQTKLRKMGKNNASAIDRLKAEVVSLRAELEATQAEQAEQIDRLTRCLLDNNIIEPADLAAVLPEPTAQDH